jgi:hypothetical protein
MGYDLHITRREHWIDEGDDISSEEWLAVVEADPELRIEAVYGSYFAIWSGPSTLGDPWLDWFDGRINTKNPDHALIDKMVEIAEKLGASVQGDDGEIYTHDEHHTGTEKVSIFQRFFGWLQNLFKQVLPD